MHVLRVYAVLFSDIVLYLSKDGAHLATYDANVTSPV